MEVGQLRVVIIIIIHHQGPPSLPPCSFGMHLGYHDVCLAQRHYGPIGVG